MEDKSREDKSNSFRGTPIDSIFQTSKKTIQDYTREIERYCRFRSVRSQVSRGVVLDDRGRLMDLYEAAVQQDAHLASVLETVESQIIGERYMLARQNDRGKYIKDVEETKKIQGSQFDKIIRGIVESKWYGYTLLEIMPHLDPLTGKLAEVNIIERRNVLPSQHRVVKRQGQWAPGWDIDSARYNKNYCLIDTGGLGLFSATTPLILAKKFTIANYVNFSHTYGQPIIHGKMESENIQDRARFAQDIANAAQNKVVVTGLNDAVDIKTFSMSNSEHIYSSLIAFVNKEVSNLIVGSESMAGATQAYVGSANAHQDIFRERIEVYREYIEHVMNEQIIPRLVKMGYVKGGLEFKYSNRVEMSNKDKINLYSFITDKYEVSADEIEKEFGIIVGRQFNSIVELADAETKDVDIAIKEQQVQTAGGRTGPNAGEKNGIHRGKVPMTDNEYFLRYGKRRNNFNFGGGRGNTTTPTKTVDSSVNFLTED